MNKNISDDLKLIKLSGKLAHLYPGEKYEKMRDRILDYVESQVKYIKLKNKSK